MWAVTGLPDRSKSVEQWSSVSRTLPQSTLCSPLLLLLFRLLLLLLIVLTPPPLSPPPLPPRQQWIQLRTIWFDNNHQFLHAHDILDPIILIWLSQKGNQSSETGRVPNITKSVVAPSLEMIKMCFQPKIALCCVKIQLTVFLSFAFHWFPVDPDRWFGTRRPTVENARKHTVGELF